MDSFLIVQGFDSRMDLTVKRFGIGERMMGQMMRLEIMPDNTISMSLSSGEYLGSHSTVSQCLGAASAVRLSLLTWIGPLSSTSTTGFITHPGLGP